MHNYNLSHFLQATLFHLFKGTSHVHMYLNFKGVSLGLSVTQQFLHAVHTSSLAYE